ncbi:hypothetical protein G4228_000725 [Cervus hanglu yarkandensis]|nr:hypothetical protein G4228_000725 [Cervus hanglu yarkandensis]
MASEKLVNLQEEVTCPICLELLTEPLTLDCGHSFCQICLTANSKESVAGQEEERKCPVCRISYESGKLRPNWHLANIVQRVREVKLSLEDQEKHLCVHHGEKLLLFCEEDGKVICWLCERSQKHRGHSTFLIEEVAQDYQKKLQAALKRLKQEQQEAKALESDFREEIAAWKNQTQHERQNVEAEFKKMRAILDSEERKELQKLKAEQTAILCTMANSENELVQQSQLVRSLISDIEHRLQGSTVQMLQMWTSIFVIPRSKTLTLEKPKPVPKEQRSMFRAPDLRDILRVFNGEECYPIHVTLSHTTGNRNIAISADRRQVTYVYKGQGQNPCWKEVYEDYGVLGSPVITSGRHYWEETLQSCLQRLKAEKQEAEKLEIEFREEMSTWKTQIQNEMQSVQENFTRLRQILDSEEVKELKKLKDELEVILKELAESENDLVKEKLLVTNLISDVEHHLQGSTVELLQITFVGIKFVFPRSESLALKKPKTFAKEQRRVFRAPDLREILRVFNVEVTLTSPRGANVVISPDQRQVRYASNHQDFNTGLNHNYENFGVLGFPVITSGRHYWEVDVSEKRAWILGVCGENCEDTMAFSFETSQNYQNVYSECQPLSFSLTNVYSGYRPKNGRRKNVYSGYQPINGSSQNVYSRYQPKNGYWVIGLKHDSVYNAFDESSSSHPVILTLSLSVSPHRVGVFLDYEARTVLFLNVTNHGFPIYKFSSCSFPQRTVPYFHPMQCEAPMTLCSPSC